MKKFSDKNTAFKIATLSPEKNNGQQIQDVLRHPQDNMVMTSEDIINLSELTLSKHIKSPFKVKPIPRVCDIASKREDFMISEPLTISLLEQKHQNMEWKNNHPRH